MWVLRDPISISNTNLKVYMQSSGNAEEKAVLISSGSNYFHVALQWFLHLDLHLGIFLWTYFAASFTCIGIHAWLAAASMGTRTWASTSGTVLPGSPVSFLTDASSRFVVVWYLRQGILVSFVQYQHQLQSPLL